MRAIGFERGDEVITTPHTFAATEEVIGSKAAILVHRAELRDQVEAILDAATNTLFI